MTNLSILADNPYRILGVYSNSPKKEIVSNKGRISAFLKVGKIVQFPLDLNTLLPAIQRTPESISQAEAHISLVKEQIKYTLFWFVNVTPIDKIAFNHLLVGNIDSAITIWNKKGCFSSLQNVLVCSLIRNDWKKAFFCANTLFREYTEEFVNLLDTQIAITPLELIHLFIDTLFEEKNINHKQFLNCIPTDTDWSSYIKEKLVQPLISSISSEIEKASAVKKENSNARYQAGNTLKQNTAMSLSNLKKLLLVTDMRYQVTADKLGLEILNCSIDYFNGSEEPDAAIKAMPLQKYALSIVVGEAAKDRCKENVDILQKVINEMPPLEIMEEDRAIKTKISLCLSLPENITNADNLLHSTRSSLLAIKQKRGDKDEYYLKISTTVVTVALHNVIEEINDIQSKMKIVQLLEYDKRSSLPKLESTFKSAWSTIIFMDSFDMEFDFKQNRYVPNRNTLKQMCEQMRIPTYSKPVYASSSTTSTSEPINSMTSKSSLSDNTNEGCFICSIMMMIGGGLGLLFSGGKIIGFIVGCIIFGGISKLIDLDDKR